jgi:hypothetical protein
VAAKASAIADRTRLRGEAPTSTRPRWSGFWVTLNQIYHKLDLMQVLVATMIKSLLSCNQECARARRPGIPFLGRGRFSWARSMNQGVRFRLRLTLATLQFRCIFTHSWSGGRLRVAKMVLWLRGQRMGTGRPEGKPHPLTRPVEARPVNGCCDQSGGATGKANEGDSAYSSGPLTRKALQPSDRRKPRRPAAATQSKRCYPCACASPQRDQIKSSQTGARP